MKTCFYHPVRFFRLRPWRLILVGLVALALSSGPGCGFLGGGDKEEPKTKVSVTVKTKERAEPDKTKPAPAEKNAPAGVEEKAPGEEKLTLEKLQAMQEAKAKEYIFQPEGLLDPFRPIEGASQVRRVEAAPEQEEPLTPLQKMELSQVKLVAVVLAGEGTSALVEDSTGLGYIVKVGTPIGTNKGKVVGIFDDRVEVEEVYKNYLGQTKTRLSALKLRTIEGEQK